MFLVLFEQCTQSTTMENYNLLALHSHMETEAASEERKHVGARNKHEELAFGIFRSSAVQLLPNPGRVVSVSMFTTRGIVDCQMVMN
jgi:hypothetical protein